jgi:diketogulonate reductase-like aldo/keto reductase
VIDNNAASEINNNAASEINNNAASLPLHTLNMFRLLTIAAFVGVASAVANVPTVTLRNGVKMPLVACGSGGDSDAQARTGVAAALKAGFPSIDTAHDYGCQKGVGDALQAYGPEKRGDIFLTTKIPGCGVPTQGLQPPCFANSMKLAEQGLSELQTPYVDLLLIHFPPLGGTKIGLGCKAEETCTKMQQQWAALEQMYAQNKTRAIGISNYCQECVECILKNATVKPMINQFQYHVGMGADPSGLIAYLHSEGIIPEAYSPLGGGKLLKNFALGEKLAPKYGFNSSAQVALAWVAQRAGSMPFVTKSSNPTYLAEDLDLFDPKHIISAEDRVALDAILAPKCSVEAPGGCCHSPSADDVSA